MPNVYEGVYLPLKLSYESLNDKHAKSLFLLCSIFPEDYNIELEVLALDCMGLRLFGGAHNLERIRDKICIKVDMLKSRFLLLEGDYNGTVKMHDVVRSV